MKTLFIIGVAALACGCGNQKQEAKIKQLEQRVAELGDAMEKRLSVDMQSLEKLKPDLAQQQTNMMTLLSMVEHLNTNQDLIDFLQDSRITNLEQALSNKAGFKSAAQPPQRMISGVPSNIYSQIAANAAKEWPGDYAMQKFEIERQVSAYLKLH